MSIGNGVKEKFMHVSKFQLGSWVLHSPTMTLEKEGVSAKLQPKTLDLLLYLINKQGEVVSRDELIQAVWPETAATDDTLNSTIAKLRKILVSDDSTERYIGTLPKRGYQLLADVKTLNDGTKKGVHSVPLLIKNRLVLPSVSFATILLFTFIYSFFGYSQSKDSAQVNNKLVVTPIAISRSLEMFPKLSNDGNNVVFARAIEDGQFSQIVSRNLLTDEEIILTEDVGFYASPVWSSDDSQIAFLSYGARGCMVGVINSLGGPAQLVAPCSLAHVYSARTALDWLKNSNSLVISQYLENQRYTGLFLHELSSGNTIQLTTPTEDSIGDFNQTVSPDGRRVVYTRMQVTGEDDIYIIDLASRHIERVAGYFGEVSSIDWMDNNSLIYVSNKTGRPETWQLDINTKQQRWYGVGGHSVANVDYHDVHKKLVLSELRTDWNFSVRNILLSGNSSIIQKSDDAQSEKISAISHDGKSLVYTKAFGKQTEIWVSKIDGSHKARIAKLWDSHVNHIDWARDGTRLLLEVVAQGKATAYVYEFASNHFYPLENIQQRGSFSPIWGVNNNLIYYSSPHAQGWAIWRHNLSTGESYKLTDLGGRKIRVDTVSNRIYFDRPRNSGMWHISTLNSVKQLPEQLPATASLAIESWRLSGSKLYYVQQSAEHISTIWRFDLLDETRSPFYTSQKRIMHFDIWGDILATTEINQCEGDIYLYELHEG